MKVKLIPLLLCLVILAACLAGCGKEPVKVEVTELPAPTNTPAPTETPAPAETPEPTETEDPETAAWKARYQAAYEKYDPEQVVMLVDDIPITWSEYYSWIYDIASQMQTSYQITDWNETREELATYVPDSTFNSYVRKTALGYVVKFAVIEQKAKELGIGLTDDQRAELDDAIEGYKTRFGGEEALNQLLSDSYITMDYFVAQLQAMTLINNIYISLYGEEGADLPDEDTVAFLKDNGFLYAKHILFSTVDEERNPLPEEEIAKKKAEAEQVLAQLRACPAEDLPTLFDSLMQQYSEDPGVLAYPDGYYFHAGEMVAPFEAAVLSLEENGLSELVETDYGYHIIFCPPMRGEHVMGYDSNYAPYSSRAYASSALFDAALRDWCSSAEYNVKYVADIDTLDLNELFGMG